MTLPERIGAFLENQYPGADFDIEKLAGDASDRSFYRALFPGGIGGGARSAVVMVLEPGGAGPDMPYLDVQRHMLDAGLPAPRTLCMDLEKGLIVLEDLGDTTLEDAVRGAAPETVFTLYRRAVDLLIDIQLDGTQKMGRDCVAFSLAFDEEKLLFELDFFFENALINYRNRPPDPGDEQEIRSGFRLIARTLSSRPRVMTHRDYHSRNIMVSPGGELAIVDFQDARMGPVQYDLASLLLDSYVQLPRDVITPLYEYYLESYGRRTGTAPDREEFDRIFNFMAAQRSIKAAGSFAYLDVVKGKDRYLRYFPPVMAAAGTALRRIGELRAFYDTLARYVPELESGDTF